jgi:hypothetical protein
VSPEDRIARARAVEQSWTELLKDTKAKGGEDAFGDRDYSGGSYFSWGEVEFSFHGKQEFFVREKRWSRVSVPGLSSTTPTESTTWGTWQVSAIPDGTDPTLCMTHHDGSMKLIHLGRGADGSLLLNGKPYKWVKRRGGPVP